jgi:hypothetical protein
VPSSEALRFGTTSNGQDWATTFIAEVAVAFERIGEAPESFPQMAWDASRRSGNPQSLQSDSHVVTAATSLHDCRTCG